MEDLFRTSNLCNNLIISCLSLRIAAIIGVVPSLLALFVSIELLFNKASTHFVCPHQDAAKRDVIPSLSALFTSICGIYNWPE